MDQCVKYGNKWVSGRSWADFRYEVNGRGAYNFIATAKSAEDAGVKH